MLGKISSKDGPAFALALLAFAGPLAAASAGPACASAGDCRLIYSNCGCEAVTLSDPRTELRSDAVCKWNLCHGTKVEAVCRSGRCCRSDAGGENAPPCPPSADVPAEPKFFPIHEIKGGALPPGEYRTEGFVAKIYACPPCPPRAMCKPCMRDNIVITERGVRLDAYALTEKEMILFTRGPGIFEVGRRYSFTFRITEGKSTSEPINDAELVSHRPLGSGPRPPPAYDAAAGTDACTGKRPCPKGCYLGPSRCGPGNLCTRDRICLPAGYDPRSPSKPASSLDLIAP